MRTSISFLAVAALMTMVACSDDDDIGNNNTLAEPQPLVFVATQNALTVETHAATDASWSGGEEIAIKVGGEVKKYKVTSTSGTLESCDANAPFYRSDKSDINVTAWYPYSDSEPAAPVVDTDQSEGLESSILMKATATAKYGETTTLAFSHQTARLRFHFYKEGTTDDLLGATVKVTVTNGSTQTEYTAHDDGDGNYSVLVAPETTISEGADFLTVTDGNVGSYKVTAPAAVTFLAGKSYEYDFNLIIPYVTFSAESEQGFKMTLPSRVIEGLGTFQYSVGDGVWVDITSEMDYVAFGGSKGNLRLRGISEVGTCTASASGNTYPSSISFEKNVPVAASGDIRTLVDYRNYSTASTVNARFAGLFKDCTVLTSAPELPATTLATSCYGSMFWGCTSLASAPELPATTLADWCYGGMFWGCTSLASAPELPATTLASLCYYNMFNGCTSLASAPELPATTLADRCYCIMFSGCTSLTSAPELLATTLAEECYYGMFADCTSLTSAPALLPATTLAEECYYNMFNGCTSLASAPELPATTLADGCYSSMFSGCTSLTSTPELPATTLAEGCYSEMFNSCTSLTSAPELPATTLAEGCYVFMFEGCTSLTSAPELPATTLASSCYGSMFSGCTSLTSAPELPATTLASSCYGSMFSGCTSLTSAPELPVTTLADYCYSGMFSNCTKLTSAPELPATTLAASCYIYMFWGCTSLTSAPELPATTLAEWCYYDMFYGCTSLVSAPELLATTLADYCYNQMFYKCTNLKDVTIKAEGYIPTNALTDWLRGVASKGTIYKKSSLTLSSGGSGIPSGWTVVEITE